MNTSKALLTIPIAIAIVIAGYFIGNSHVNSKKLNRSVVVKGLSEREVTANLAVWPTQIVLTGNDLGELQQKIEHQSKAVYQFFIKQGFDKSEFIKGVFNIQDAKANLYNNHIASFRYLAKSEFTLKTKNVDKLQETLTASLNLLSKGILFESKNTWKPIDYVFTDLNSLKPSMIEEATKNAKEVAKKFAKDSNAKVGKIKKAYQGQFSITNSNENTPKTKLVRVVSTVEYFLED